MTTTTTMRVAQQESFWGVSSLNKVEWVGRKSRESYFWRLLYDTTLSFYKLVDSEQTYESIQTRPSLCKIERFYSNFNSTFDLTCQSFVES